MIRVSSIVMRLDGDLPDSGGGLGRLGALTVPQIKVISVTLR